MIYKNTNHLLRYLNKDVRKPEELLHLFKDVKKLHGEEFVETNIVRLDPAEDTYTVVISIRSVRNDMTSSDVKEYYDRQMDDELFNQLMMHYRVGMLLTAGDTFKGIHNYQTRGFHKVNN